MPAPRRYTRRAALRRVLGALTVGGALTAIVVALRLAWLREAEE